MRGFLFALCVLCPSISWGQVALGKDQPVRAPLCMTKEDAIKIAKADVEQGIEVAIKLFNEAQECDIFQGVVKPLRVVYSGPTARGTTLRVLEVEISLESGHKRNFFMLVDAEIIGLQST